MKYLFFDIIKGFVIGMSILIPGLSGGTTALLLKVYKPIIDSLSNIKNKKNVCFLSKIVIGAALGIFLGAFPIKAFFNTNSSVFSILIIGVILGSIPVFTDNFNEKPFRNFLLILFGILTTLFLEKISFVRTNELSLIFLSLLMAVALILPGISITNILITFGMYETVLSDITEFNLFFLFKIALYLILSSALIIKLISFAYKKYPVSINMLILGMVIASVKQVSLGITTRVNPAVFCLLLFIGIIFSICIVLLEKSANTA